MGSSREYFKARMIYSDETIQTLFRTEYYVYEKLKLLIRVLIALALILSALFVPLKSTVKLLCLLIGSWLFVARDFPSKIRAERVLQQRGGFVSEVQYHFNPSGIYVKNGLDLKYNKVDRLIEDDNYYYIFQSRQSAVMVPKEDVESEGLDKFRVFIEGKTNKEFKRVTGLIGVNLKELISMTKDYKLSKNKTGM